MQMNKQATEILRKPKIFGSGNSMASNACLSNKQIEWPDGTTFRFQKGGAFLMSQRVRQKTGFSTKTFYLRRKAIQFRIEYQLNGEGTLWSKGENHVVRPEEQLKKPKFQIEQMELALPVQKRAFAFRKK
ncbi:hypothetical protein [Planococcus sp. CP5-4]|uniref:hypothetical protein n=1 Tax=unclassified Planococcus (in: firmicutes) TaxID=2662419 RepID=UPI0027E5BBFE|nr:hypothetical protein [Planococcus sp. CP5-4]